MFEIKFLCPRWGYEGTPWRQFLSEVKEAGYAGIEWFPFGEEGGSSAAEVVAILNELELDFSIVMTVTKPVKGFEDYLGLLRNDLRQLSTIAAGGKIPLFITAQTGREFFSEAQVLNCLDVCDEVASATGIPILQETHRNKWSFAAHTVHPILRKRKNLALTLDISHWFCVSESYLEDQQTAVDEAIRHTRHIHARVGNTESPQVWDPSLEEYHEALEAHTAVWDRWIRNMQDHGATTCTITPEFGPPPYLVRGNRQISLTREQWRLNLWMKQYLTTRYMGAPPTAGNPGAGKSDSQVGGRVGLKP